MGCPVARSILSAMSATWQILSPLTPREMLDLEAECTRVVTDYLDDHPDCDDAWGELGVGGALPTQPEVVSGYQRYRLALPKAILEKLAACRSSMTIDRPGDLAVDRLQVSVLRYLVERAGDGLVLFNDYPFVMAARVLTDLRKAPSAREFTSEAPPPPRKIRKREARPGELRAIRIVGVLKAAAESLELAVDVRDVLTQASAIGRQYAALLMEEGAVDDANASRALGVPGDVLDREATSLDEALARVR